MSRPRPRPEASHVHAGQHLHALLPRRSGCLGNGACVLHMRSNAKICPVANARYAMRVWPCDGQKRQKNSRWSDFHRLLPLSCERFYIVRSNFWWCPCNGGRGIQVLEKLYKTSTSKRRRIISPVTGTLPNFSLRSI